MVYIIPKKLKEETKLFSFGHGMFSLYLKDVAALMVWAGLFSALHGYVHSWLMAPYGLFGIATGVYLIMPAKTTNPGKRHWEALLLLLGKSRGALWSLNQEERRGSVEKG